MGVACLYGDLSHLDTLDHPGIEDARRAELEALADRHEVIP